MADYQQNFLASLQGGLNIGQQVRGIQNRNQLNQLASKAYQAAPEERQAIYGQAASIDAGSAGALEKQLGSNEDRRNTTMVNMAKLLTTAPPQARPGLYQRMVPTLSQYGMTDLPQQYDESTAPIIDQAAQSLVSAFNGLDKNTPTDVRSFQQMTAGLSQEDRERARRINLGLDGRASSSGFSQVKFTGADGRERIGVLNGKTGQIDLPDGTSFNPQTGAISQTMGGGVSTQPAQVLPQGGGQQVVEQDAAMANQMIAAGIPPEQVDAFLTNRAASFNAGAAAQPQGIAPQAFVGRRAEDQAAAVEAAKQGVQQQFLPQELAARTDAAIRQSAGIEQAKSQQERASNERAKTAQLNNVDRGLGRIDSALKGLTGRFVDTGPIDGRIIGPTPQGQELEAAVGAIQNDMLALTRVPGIGSQSDLEAKIANLKYPSIYNAPEVNARNVQQLKAFLGDLRRQIQAAPDQAQPAAAGGAPRQIQSADEYNALPSGALFIAPDGTQRRKR